MPAACSIRMTCGAIVPHEEGFAGGDNLCVRATRRTTICHSDAGPVEPLPAVVAHAPVLLCEFVCAHGLEERCFAAVSTNCGACALGGTVEDLLLAERHASKFMPNYFCPKDLVSSKITDISFRVVSDVAKPSS